MSSNYEMLGPIVRSARAKLQAGLPAALATLRSELPADEAAALIDPAEVLDYVPDPAVLTDVSMGPVLGIMDLPSRLEDDIGSAATGRHEFLVLAFMVNQDQRMLALGLRHYITAVIRVINGDRHLDDVPGFITLGVSDTYPGETLGRESDPQTWLSWSAVRFWCARDEQ